MNEVYADPNHVYETLRNHTAQSDEDNGRVTILATDAVVKGDTREELEERNLTSVLNLIDDQICTIKWERNTFGNNFTLCFHQSAIEREFTLNPASRRAIAPQQGTDPRDLSDDLHRALSDLDDDDPIYTFAEVSAGSMAGGGHFTDFEFEYSIDGLNL